MTQTDTMKSTDEPMTEQTTTAAKDDYIDWQIENDRRRRVGLEILLCEWRGERTLNRDLVQREQTGVQLSVCQGCALHMPADRERGPRF